MLDELVEGGIGVSRSAVVRKAVARLHDAERRRQVGERIAQSYLLQPGTDEEHAWAVENAIALAQAQP